MVIPESNDVIFSSCHFKIIYALHTAFIDRYTRYIDASILNLQYRYAYRTIMYCDASMHHSIVPSLILTGELVCTPMSYYKSTEYIE